MLLLPNILFETSKVLVVEKPAGLTTEHDARYDSPSLESWAAAYLRKHPKQKVFAAAAHRLDRPVSGLLVMAKNKSTLQLLHEQFRLRMPEKYYTALVEGEIPAEKGVLKHWHVKDQQLKKALLYSTSKPQSAPVSLEYQILEKLPDRTLVEIRLHTGKFHQIRAQMAAIGHPVCGDQKYGAKTVYRENAICLHASSLRILLPEADSPQWFTSAPDLEGWKKMA